MQGKSLKSSNKTTIYSIAEYWFSGLICPSKWIVHFFRDRPGLYILPGLLKKEALEQWFSHTIQYAKPPNTTNLTVHGQVFQE